MNENGGTVFSARGARVNNLLPAELSE